MLLKLHFFPLYRNITSMLYNIILLKPCACDAGYCAFNQCNAEFQNQLTYKYSLSAKLFQIRLNKSAGLLLCRIIIILSFAWAFCNLTFIFIKANSLISKVHDKQDQWFSITQLQLPSGLIYYRSFLYFLCLSKISVYFNEQWTLHWMCLPVNTKHWLQ